MPPTLSNRAPYRTRTAASSRLESLGWTKAGTSHGDFVYTHPNKGFANLITRLRSGWEIQAWGTLVLDAKA